MMRCHVIVGEKGDMPTFDDMTHLFAFVCFHVISSAVVSPGNGHTFYDAAEKNEADGDDEEMLKHRGWNLSGSSMDLYNIFETVLLCSFYGNSR